MADDLTTPITACDNAIAHWTRIGDNHRDEAAKGLRIAKEHGALAADADSNKDKWVAAKQALLRAQEG